MKFYVKTTYLKPVENTQKLKNYNETYLVNALSVTEAEAKIINWLPANFQDPEVKSATKAKIADVNRVGDSEIWWTARVAYDDTDGFSKPFTVAINADTMKQAILELEKLYLTSWFWSISSTSTIFDQDLLSDQVLLSDQ